MTLKGFVGLVVLAAFAALLAGGIVQRGYEAKLKLSQERADAYKGRAEVAVAAVRTIEVVAEIQAARAKVQLAEALKRSKGIRLKVDTVQAEAVPDTCKPMAARRDSLIGDLLQVNDSLKGAALSLDSANVNLTVANDSLHSAVASLDSAVTELRHPPKRPLFAVLFHPDIVVGPGVFVGVCASGKTCAGAGATASLKWSFKFP